MDRPIRRLPEILINRVAAGEVVERPAAVVKELVENAIDAGAGDIRVSFQRAGKDFISVDDDGSGMGREDVPLALERHATSKIATSEDLNGIRSFGFRGEALPSIASVARLVLRSRRRRDGLGTEIIVDDGVQISMREIVMSPGTAIRVEHLFQSVPARRKFLRTDQTEANRIIETMRSFALVFPEITFRLRHGDRTIFELARSSREDRIRQLWGDSFANGLCRIEAEEDGRRLEWFVVRPGHSLSPVAAEMLFFVNGRQIYSKELKEWLLESCGAHFSNCRALPSILFLDLPPEQVDVNVHPTKREVRFSDRAALRKFLMGKIERGLWEQNRSICWALPPRQNCGWDREMECPEAQKAPCVPKLDPKSEQRPPSFSANMDVEPLPKAFSGPDRRVEPPAEVQSKTLGWRYIGLLNRDCALFDSGTGLVFFEMKKAALHVARQRLLSTLDCPARQRLLTPIELNLSGWSEEGKNARLCALGRFGFTVETDPAGRHRATEVPCWLDGAHAETFLRTYLSTDPPPDFAEAISQFLAPAETVRDERYAAQLLEAVATSARPHLSAACHEIPYAEIRRRILES